MYIVKKVHTLDGLGMKNKIVIQLFKKLAKAMQQRSIEDETVVVVEADLKGIAYGATGLVFK